MKRMKAVTGWVLVNDRGKIWTHFHDDDMPKIFAKKTDALLDAKMATAWRIARVRITEVSKP